MPEALVANTVNTVAQLQQRIVCNESGARSFARFVLEVLEPRVDDSALDIGCGLGAQLIPLAAQVRRAIGLDVSTEMLAELRRRNTAPNVAVIAGDMDDMSNLELDEPVTLAYAVYSLYYSRDPGLVINSLANLVHGPRARVVTINPDIGNNTDWFADLGRLYDVPANARDVPEFCRGTIIPAFLETFTTVRRIPYRDHVQFPTLDALMKYYDACAPYCRPDKREAAHEYFGAKFERDGKYQITKCSLALVGRL